MRNSKPKSCSAVSGFLLSLYKTANGQQIVADTNVQSRVVNADNGAVGVMGGYVSFVKENALEPGEVSEIKRLVFRMSEQQPDPLQLGRQDFKSLLSIGARV